MTKKSATATTADSATLSDTMTRGQKAAATRKANQAKEAIRLLAEQTAAAEAPKMETSQERLERVYDEQELANWNSGVATPEAPEGEDLIEDTRTYHGPMLALRERAKRGLYQKAVNGQPSCGDEVATALGVLAPEQVIRACIIALALEGNPYLHLNIGQQSMNLRNKLRGAMKRGEFGMGVVREAVEDVLIEQAEATE